MKIAIGSDHGGFELKEFLKEDLKETEIEFVDCGTDSTESVDYPDFGQAVGEAVAGGKADLGIVICGTGIGISMAANKVEGIRCALCHGLYDAKMAKNHNNANVLALGGRVTGKGLASEMVKFFLEEEFEAGRHERRVQKINNI